MPNKKQAKKLKSIKVSTLVFWLIIIISIILFILGINENPNTQVINIFSDTLKILVGALAGAIAGERENE